MGGAKGGGAGLFTYWESQFIIGTCQVTLCETLRHKKVANCLTLRDGHKIDLDDGRNVSDVTKERLSVAALILKRDRA